MKKDEELLEEKYREEQKKIINEFKLKINGVWYYSVLYDDNTVVRTPLGKDEKDVQFRNKITKTIC